ncbi:MAG: ComEA family DNA-binding protein [Bacteroidota bacterium]
MWQRLVDWLALTSVERKVILFLGGTLLLGAGIRLYQEAFSTPRQFDYTAADSTFAALSQAVRADSLSESEFSSKKLDINAATKQELLSLPGIGEVLADRILQHRKEHGSFRTISDLLKIKGISKNKLEQFKNFITIDTVPHTPSEE